MFGAVFCSECGSRLDIEDITELQTTIYDDPFPPSAPLADTGIPPVKPPMTDTPFQSQPIGQPTFTERELQDAPVALKVFSTGKIIPLTGGEEFTLGRISGNQPILPDVDLTSEQAYKQGVSRLHATIRIMEDRITITDLGSANGTRVNRKMIQAQVPHPLTNGDLLHLGKFKLQIRIHK
jgi:hypothetical protein